MISRQTGLLAVGAAGLVVAAHATDRWGLTNLSMPGIYERDWGRLLRVLGYAPTWLVIAALFWLESRTAPTMARLARTAAALVVAVAVAGLAAEAVKLVVRRERPDPAVAGYLFRAFADQPFSTKALGFPSSHAAVAFGAAGAIGQRFRRAAPILLALAAGCGLTRVLAGAHFLSDVAGGAVLGAVAGWWIGRRIDPMESPG